MAAVSSSAVPEDLEDAWQGIAGLNLRPGKAVHFYQHHYRGIPWLIIADQENENYFRCSSNAREFLELLDGSRTVEQALDESQRSQSSSLQQQDIVLLIANLKNAGLLQDGLSTGTRVLQPPVANPWLRPFAIKIPLFDPDKFLQKTVIFCRPLFTPVALLLWSGLVVLAVITALLHWQELVEHSEARFADPKNLLWYWLLYPILKSLHEFGHAYATRMWGGAVHEMGVMLLVFFPVPYVDSSAAHRFSSKKHRLLVSACGIMVEIFLASLALFLWINTDHGLLRDLAFDIIVIGGISTLLFNANPLLRFDGYYIFSELLEIPNLGTRSDQYLGYLFKKFIFGIPGMRSPVTAAGEVKWLVIYGICSRIYRVLISLVIAFWVAGKFFIVGILLALWALVMQIFYPFAQGILRLVPEVVKANRLKRFVSVVGFLVFICLAGLVVPFGHSTYAEGVVSLPANTLIRAGADGIVSQVLVADGERVERAAIILKLENHSLEARRQTLLARLEELHARQGAVFLLDRSQAETYKSKVSSIAADLRDAEEQQKALEVESIADGVISLPNADDLPGRYVNRGDIVGYVLGQNQITAQVAIPQLEIDTVRRNMGTIEVKLDSRPAETFNAQFLRELPQATDQLPNRMLGTGSGGGLAVDTRDETGVQLMSNIFLMEIGFPLNFSANFLGQRIYVRFIHEDESLGNRLVRRLKQFMLQAPFI